jgi:NADH:ubiquinone oxidoreductase subunit 5 (subunit L)/multisubunit Na+/H+ antiporter MnhA subunit
MEERIDLLMVLIPALPLAATVITAALGRYVLRELSHWPVLLATVTAFALSLVLLYDVRTAASAATAGSATHAA